MTTTEGRRFTSSIGRRLVLVVLLLGCSGTSASNEDGGGDGVSISGDGALEGWKDAAIEARACGGTVDASGTTPSGAFDGTDVHLRVVFVCRRVDVTITDLTTGGVLAFSVRPSSDGGVLSLVGQQTVTAAFAARGSTATTTMATVNVTMADDPFTGGNANAQPTGHMEGTFTLAQDGFSVSGSFSSPYCMNYTCPV
jgi:hypothetical protein